MPTQYLIRSFAIIASIILIGSGCNALPDVRHETRFHNPFPQIHSVAILPFRNQSEEATLSGERVSLAYSHELQSVPGFEVLPVGVVRVQLLAFEQTKLGHSISRGEDFQAFAQYLGVDCVLQGAIIDYEPYYPPRLTMKVNWYAANPGFNPVPVGYGLPWGTKAEKEISEATRLEAERELATEQLKTQLPLSTPQDSLATDFKPQKITVAANSETIGTGIAPVSMAAYQSLLQTDAPEFVLQADQSLQKPRAWPDPEGFIPPAPTPFPAPAVESTEPVITHMYTYDGRNESFTSELEEYFYFSDDDRFGGWEAYLQRSEDFIRFCCHLHIKQTLIGRGGQLKNRTVVRWPISRYER